MKLTKRQRGVVGEILDHMEEKGGRWVEGLSSYQVTRQLKSLGLVVMHGNHKRFAARLTEKGVRLVL